MPSAFNTGDGLTPVSPERAGRLEAMLIKVIENDVLDLFEEDTSLRLVEVREQLPDYDRVMLTHAIHRLLNYGRLRLTVDRHLERGSS